MGDASRAASRAAAPCRGKLVGVETLLVHDRRIDHAALAAASRAPAPACRARREWKDRAASAAGSAPGRNPSAHNCLRPRRCRCRRALPYCRHWAGPHLASSVAPAPEAWLTIRLPAASVPLGLVPSGAGALSGCGRATCSRAAGAVEAFWPMVPPITSSTAGRAAAPASGRAADAHTRAPPEAAAGAAAATTGRPARRSFRQLFRPSLHGAHSIN